MQASSACIAPATNSNVDALQAHAVPVPDISYEACRLAADWDLALGVNIKGYAFGIKHASLEMIRQRQSRCSNLSPEETAVLDLGHAIVNVSSISAFMAQPGFVPYSSTKAAINGMTRCCALDLGKHCIR